MQKDGATLRTHLERAAKQGAKVDQLNDAPPLPEWAYFLWDLFISLSNARQWADGRPRGIPPSEILAHCKIAKIELEPIEFKLFRDLDLEYITHYGR